MAEICTTCLSNDGILLPISHEQLQILNILCYPKTMCLNNRIVKLCRRCDSKMQEMHMFRTKALKSLDYLAEHWKNSVQRQPVLEISPLTKPTLQECVVENRTSNIKIEECREMLDETEINVKSEQSLEERDALEDIGTEDGSLGHASTNNLSSSVTNKCVKAQWYAVKLDEKDILAEMEQNRQKREYLEAKYRCHSCAIVFPGEFMFNKHNKAFHDEGSGPFCCNICTSRFSGSNELSKHKTLHSTTAFFCACGFKTYSKKDIIKHGRSAGRSTNRIAAQEKVKPKRKYAERTDRTHGCKYCGKTFKSRGNIFMHIQLKHRILPTVQCDICKSTLKNIYTLRAHMKLKHTENPKAESSADNYCQLCNVWFTNKWTYRMHMRMSGKHDNNKDKFKFACDQCDLKFFYKRLLDNHKNIVHLKKKPFNCSMCDQKFAAKRNMQRHIDSKHLNKVKDTTKKFVCEVCGSAFALSITLRNHRYIHSTERPFKCKECGDTFKQSSSLYNHNKLVHQGFKREAKS